MSTSYKELLMKKCEKTWSSQIVEHKGFKDLGNYVIELTS